MFGSALAFPSNCEPDSPSIAAASGISERAIIEDALRKYLDATDDTALLLRRFDRVDRALARDHRDLELLSEAFSRYMRLWFLTHAPNTAEAGKAAARGAAETQYRQFAQHLGEHFKQGSPLHRRFASRGVGRGRRQVGRWFVIPS